MKEKIIYISTFLLAFILVTGMIFVMNNKYENIFRLDTRDHLVVLAEKIKQDSIKVVQDSLRLKTVRDSLFKLEYPDSLLSKSTGKDDKTGESTPNGVSEGPSRESTAPSSASIAGPSKEKLKAEKDSLYIRWKRETVKLYEGMEAKQIAKVLPSFADDVARDLIYSMKKKKAAEILTLLSPEMVHKLTRAQ